MCGVLLRPVNLFMPGSSPILGFQKKNLLVLENLVDEIKLVTLEKNGMVVKSDQ